MGLLGWALVFFIVSLFAAAFGFFGLAGVMATIAKVLFFVFIVLFVLSLIAHLVRGRPTAARRP